MRDYGFSPAQQDEIWRRWREGQSFSLIGRAFGAPMRHARRFVYQSGGVRLTPQQRSERHLSGSEREEISRGIAVGESGRQLAKRLGRSPSTVSREIARNGGRDRYRAASADEAAYARGRRPQQAKLAQRPAHTVAITQIRMPGTRGHTYYQAKLAEGKTPREARRCLKRRLADHVWRTMIGDERRHTRTTGPGGQPGATA
ncbi:helix-turn-helix domain-containing protein, partial [Streptomyces lycopersici]|uniref:helix-turn-helix domain-containing protein n=1 Tax=Streptomyces lycopersici TaxID=2974589 RepID=UPI003D160A16